MPKFGKKTNYIKFPNFYPHQKQMYTAGKTLLRKQCGKGWFSIPTGGGKSFPMYKLILDGFKKGLNVQAMLSPKIALNNQHFNMLELLTAFKNENIIPIFFHTGKIKFLDSTIKFYQTTKPKELHKILSSNKNKNVLIFTTYASDETFLDENNGIDLNFNYINEIRKYVKVIHADEFHHFAQQTEENKEFVKNLPGMIFFYSASIFKGELFSVEDEDLFGKCLCKTTIRELQELGIIVPTFDFKFYHLNNLKVKKLKQIVKDIAYQKGFDITLAYKEIALIISHFNYVYDTAGVCKMLLYTKDKQYAKLFVDNFDKFRPLLNIKTDPYVAEVFAETSSEDRHEIFENIGQRDNCIIVNYSVILEGIDVPSFNSILFGRYMGIIGLQQGSGRGSRTNSDDKQLFKDGIYTINDSDLSTKMIKPAVYYGFGIHGEDVSQDIKNIFKRLINIGVDLDTILKSIEEEKTKKKLVSDTDEFELGNIVVDPNIVKNALSEIESEQFEIEFQSKVNALDDMKLNTLLTL